MRVLLVSDKAMWAYASIAKSITKYNPYPEIEIDTLHIKSDLKQIKKSASKFDKFLVMGWQNYEKTEFLPKKDTLVGIHSFHSWDNKETTPEKDATPPRKLIDLLASFRGVNAVSQRLTDLFTRQGLKVAYTANGVDTEIFRPTKNCPTGDTLKVGYSGSKAHDWRKGVSEFILPAAKKAGVDVNIAMLSTDDYVPLEDMYKFYNEIDCYVCASSSEGMSLSVLEAAACGRPVIGTKVSGNTEIIKDGITGYLVDRAVDAIAEKIEVLKDKRKLAEMSYTIHADILANWSWKIRAKAWIDFLRDA